MPNMDMEFPKEAFWKNAELSQWMLETALKFTHNAHKAEDLRQQAYIKLHKSPRKKFCPKHVITILKNCWRDELRRELRRKEKLEVLRKILSSGLLQPGAQIRDRRAIEDAVEALARAIRTLPDADRRLLELRYLAKNPCSVQETAARLGLTESAVKQRCRRVLRKLRQKLTPQ